MKEVMWKGELEGKIALDTIANTQNLYGLGPAEYLSGEILILDGKSYKSSVISETEMKVEESFDLKAPFFGYAHIEQWEKVMLPDSVRTIPQLEHYLEETTKMNPRPFFFKLSGEVEEANIHVVNLPKGTKVSSPQEAHQGQKNYKLHNRDSEILGFFSTRHKGIFTHHDSFLHLHLITKDKEKMGHLDEMLLKKENIILYLPLQNP